VRTTAAEVLARTSLLRSLISENQFVVVDAVFSLETGEVDFSDRRLRHEVAV
jgi:hypothetical protein